MRYVKNEKEILKINNLMNRDTLLLSAIICEIVGDEVVEAEQFCINNIVDIEINNIIKNIGGYKFIKHLKIEGLMNCINGNTYKFNEWFVWNSKKDVFGLSDVIADYDYYID